MSIRMKLTLSDLLLSEFWKENQNDRVMSYYSTEQQERKDLKIKPLYGKTAKAKKLKAQKAQKEAYDKVMQQINKELGIETSNDENQGLIQKFVCNNIKEKITKSKSTQLVKEEVLDDGSIVLTVRV